MRAIEDGVDVDARGADGATALHLGRASRRPRARRERCSSAAPIPMRANDYGVTPLAAAAVEADSEIVEGLLEAGADVEVAERGGADRADGRRAYRSRRLPRGCCSSTARTSMPSKRWGGQSALMWAAAQKQPEMIRVLIEHGAAVDARGLAHDWQRRVTAEPRIKIMQTGGFTPLLYAAREGCAACVERARRRRRRHRLVGPVRHDAAGARAVTTATSTRPCG